MAAAAAVPRAGTIIDQRYVLGGLLGEGSFGAVWRAHDQRLSNRAVAVKLLKSEFLEQESAVRRFDAEADALAQISHPNIVGVLDRGVWKEQRYIVMEFVEGRGLSGWLADHRRQSERPSLSMVLGLFDQLCAGLEAAHAVRTPGPIVHRDLKPDNILLRTSQRGEITVKVVDFGIAQLGRRTATRSGVTMGTPLYMAPEQAFGHSGSVGTWTDVFTLGVVLIELLTLDAQATEDDSWWVVAVRRPRELRAMLHARRADVPVGLWDVIAQCLQTEGSDRFVDAGALRVAVREVALSLPGGLSLPPWRASSPVPSSPSPPTAATPLERRPSPPYERVPTDRDDPAAVAHAATQLAPSDPLLDLIAPDQASMPEPPPLRWGRLFALVSTVAALMASSIVGLLVWRDAHPAASRAPLTPAAPVTNVSGRLSLPGPVDNDPELMNLLRRWDSAMRLQPGAMSLDRFYAPRVWWHAQATDVAGIGAQLERSVSAGGTNSFDWTRSTWEYEDVASSDVPPACRSVPGATGDVVKVRAWNDEYRVDRHSSIGCARLEGRYLLRLRRTPAGLRICHETWSVAEGICASCPTASVCPRH
jgi:serine/threonine protein kinase